MNNDLLEDILKFVLSDYLTMSDGLFQTHLAIENFETKRRVGVINDLELHIYSNDHNPPHFHVKTNDLGINAKFSIENCELLSGDISSKQLKRIKAFYNSPKGKIIFQKIWNTRLI